MLTIKKIVDYFQRELIGTNNEEKWGAGSREKKKSE